MKYIRLFGVVIASASLVMLTETSFSQIIWSNDVIVDGDFQVTGDSTFLGNRVGMGISPQASLHIRTTSSEPNGALLLQRGYSWSEDGNYYIKLLTESGASAGMVVNGYGKTMASVLGVGSIDRSDYPSGLTSAIPFNVHGGGGTVGEFASNDLTDDRSMVRFKSRTSAFMYLGAKAIDNHKTQVAFYNQNGDTANPIMVINDSIEWDGRVGIGVDQPTAKLDVRGGLNATGKVRFERQGDILMGEFGLPE